MLVFFLSWLAVAVIVSAAFAAERWWAFVMGMIMVVLVMASCSGNASYQAHERESKAEAAAQWKAKTTPRVLSATPDGCTVYVFTTDRDHYFTRCGARVSTETNWKESCGKSCSKDKSDTITTEGNK